MQRQQRANTTPELALRRELHRRGLRYRLHKRAVASLRRRQDIIFGPARVAVEVKGCYWHACPEHGSIPKANRSWWLQKFEQNVARDRDTALALERAGWLLIEVWEHEDPAVAAARIARVLKLRLRRRARHA